MKKAVVFIVSVFLLISCGNDVPTIDGTDQVGFNQSLASLKKELKGLQQRKISEAIQLVYDYRTNESGGNRWEQVRTILHEKTADDIFTLAEEIAEEKEINWGRNQAPYAGGLPKPKDEVTVGIEETKQVDSPIKEANTIDLDSESTESGIQIYSTFLRQDGTIIRFNKKLNNVLIEVFSENSLVHSFKTSINSYKDVDPNFGGSGLFISYKDLKTDKIKSNQLSIKVRAPHPEKYLIQRTKVKIPEQYVGFVEEKQEIDSTKTVEKVAAKSPNEAISKAIVKRFLSNVKKGDLNRAYGLTKNPKWTSYKSFTSKEVGFGDLKNITKEEFLYDGGEANQAVVKAGFDAENSKNEKASYGYVFTLSNENNQWFITDCKLVQQNTYISEEVIEDIKKEAETQIEYQQEE